MNKEEKTRLIADCIDAELSMDQIVEYLAEEREETPAEWLEKTYPDSIQEQENEKNMNEFLNEQFPETNGKEKKSDSVNSDMQDYLNDIF